MGDLLKLYEEGFARVQPGVRFENNLESTLTAVSGVASGKAEIGLLGREIWPQEAAAFAAARGHAPLVLDIATGSYDVPKATFALMVFVPGGRTPSPASTWTTGAQIFTASNGSMIQAPPATVQRTWGELDLWAFEWVTGPSISPYGFRLIDDHVADLQGQFIFASGDTGILVMHESANQ